MNSEIGKYQFLEESWVLKTQHKYNEYSIESKKEIFGNFFMWGASRFIKFYFDYLKTPKNEEARKAFIESFEKRSSRLYENEIYGVERFEEALPFIDSKLWRIVEDDYNGACRSLAFFEEPAFFLCPVEENGKKIMKPWYPDIALMQKREKMFSCTLDKYEQLCRKALFPTVIQDRPSLEAQNFFERNGLKTVFDKLVHEGAARWRAGKLDYAMSHGEFKSIIQNEVQDFKSWGKLSKFISKNGKVVTAGTLQKSYRR
jgi:AAA15 family ATPase/GTPase